MEVGNKEGVSVKTQYHGEGETMNESERIGKAVVNHYAAQLPKIEDYPAMGLKALSAAHRKLYATCGAARNQLARVPDDQTAGDLLNLYTPHLDAARAALAQKVG